MVGYCGRRRQPNDDEGFARKLVIWGNPSIKMITIAPYLPGDRVNLSNIIIRGHLAGGEAPNLCKGLE